MFNFVCTRHCEKEGPRSSITADKDSQDIRQVNYAATISLKCVRTCLKRHERLARLGNKGFTVHSFRVRAAISGAIVREDIVNIMAEIC